MSISWAVRCGRWLLLLAALSACNPSFSSSSSLPTSIPATMTPAPSPTATIPPTTAPTPLPTAMPTQTPPPPPTATLPPTVAPTPPPTGAATPANDTPPTTTAGCDLNAHIGLLETIPGKYQLTVGIDSVGGTACPAPTTLSLTVVSGALSLTGLSPAYEYNGSAGWSCSGTICTATAAIPANPPGTMYQVGFQTMATLSSGSAQVCASVGNSWDSDLSNNTPCVSLP